MWTKTDLAPHFCDVSECMKKATHSVYDERGWRHGDFCEKHADRKVEANNRYQAATTAASR